MYGFIDARGSGWKRSAERKRTCATDGPNSLVGVPVGDVNARRRNILRRGIAVVLRSAQTGPSAVGVFLVFSFVFFSFSVGR